MLNQMSVWYFTVAMYFGVYLYHIYTTPIRYHYNLQENYFKGKMEDSVDFIITFFGSLRLHLPVL